MIMSSKKRAFGEFLFDPTSGELWSAGVKVEFQNQPAKVLDVLTSNPGALVSREEIRKAVWGEQTFVNFDLNLNYCIRRIRRALGDSAKSPRFFETIPRRGYRFVAKVESPPGRVRSERSQTVRLIAAVLIGAFSGAAIAHDFGRSQLHDKVVSWVHTQLELPFDQCPWAGN
jgi:DNA-binding winged helix-turn-helix (wHTH) protein